MKQLNGIELINYSAYDNEVTFSFNTDEWLVLRDV